MSLGAVTLPAMTTTALPMPMPLAPVDGPEPLRLSFSRVDTYESCPLRYRFSYIDVLPGVPGPHLSWGSSIHAALETWWDQKLPEAPPVEVLLDELYAQW